MLIHSCCSIRNWSTDIFAIIPGIGGKVQFDVQGANGASVVEVEYESADCVKYSIGYRDTSGTGFFPKKTDKYCKDSVPLSLN